LIGQNKYLEEVPNEVFVLHLHFNYSFFLFLNCDESKIIRTVQEDNVFYSSYQPKIGIKINPESKHFTDDQFSDAGFSSDRSLAASNVTVERYYFIKSRADKTRVIQIIIQKLNSPRWSFEQNIIPFDNVYDLCSFKSNRISYKYSIFANKALDRSPINSSIGRLLGSNYEAMIIINYSENVSGDWSNLTNTPNIRNDYKLRLSCLLQVHLTKFTPQSNKSLMTMLLESAKPIY
jgi:hypothetical protein